MRRRRLLALVSVLCMVSGAFAQAPRGCSVCPVDCPMHSARPERPRCHQATGSTPQRSPEPATGCAVRSTCGHVEHGLVGLPAVLPSRGTVSAARVVRATPAATRRAPDTLAPEPAGHPPESLRVRRPT